MGIGLGLTDFHFNNPITELLEQKLQFKFFIALFEVVGHFY